MHKCKPVLKNCPAIFTDCVASCLVYLRYLGLSYLIVVYTPLLFSKCLFGIIWTVVVHNPLQRIDHCKAGVVSLLHVECLYLQISSACRYSIGLFLNMLLCWIKLLGHDYILHISVFMHCMSSVVFLMNTFWPLISVKKSNRFQIDILE